MPVTESTVSQLQRLALDQEDGYVPITRSNRNNGSQHRSSTAAS